MATANLTLDETVVKGIVAAAILEAIGPEQQRAIIVDAINQLMEDRKEQYSSRTIPGSSPLAQAFKRAVLELADRAVQDLVNEEAIKTQVEQAIRARVQDLLANEYDTAWLDSAITEAVTKRAADVVRRRD